MNEPTVIAAAIVTVIAAVAAAIVTIINAMASALERQAAHKFRLEAAATAAHTLGKVEDVSAKADVITGHVNSAATKSAERIDALMKQVENLTQQLADRKEIAAVLAQAQAAAQAPPHDR